MKLVILSAVLASTLLISGCESDSDDSSPATNPDAETGADDTTAADDATAAGDATESETPVAEVILGESGDMGTSAVETWAELDADGVVISVGFTAGAQGLTSLTAETHVALNWPEAVKTQTFFHYLGMDFMHEGHGPEMYLHPHFDVHFYGEDAAETASIDCAAEPMPANLEAGVPAMGNDIVPDFYMIPGPALEPEGSCVPGMGVHALDVRSGELQLENPSPFTTTLVLGYHAGALSFIEPMVTQEHLTMQGSWSWDVPRPTTLGRSVLWPATLDFTYESETDTYRVVFSDFSPID